MEQAMKWLALIMQTTACVAGVNGKGIGRENYCYDSTVKLREHVLREVDFEQSYQLKAKLISFLCFCFLGNNGRTKRMPWKEK